MLVDGGEGLHGGPKPSHVPPASFRRKSHLVESQERPGEVQTFASCGEVRLVSRLDDERGGSGDGLPAERDDEQLASGGLTVEVGRVVERKKGRLSAADDLCRGIETPGEPQRLLARVLGRGV